MDAVLIKAFVPRELKRRAFSSLALQEETFSAWLRVQLERLVDEDVRVEGSVEQTEHPSEGRQEAAHAER